ncbi:MAG TPA: peroxiredoxin family protein [Gemmatimonadaceae bacterium]|nr:peroxiredoxin family protein [Gemmatimonadaceae bacterium]
MSARLVRLGALGMAAAALAFTANLEAQTAPAVSSMAPDFTSSGATRYGVLATPVSLSDYRGKTVVLAFFPKARTRGCTIQMESYRDRYDSLFNGGKDVVVMGISADPDSALVNWAREADFPVLFVSDVEGKIGTLYGAWNAERKYDTRALFIVAPDGRITYTTPAFNVLSADAYAELQSEVEKARGTSSAGAHSGH